MLEGLETLEELDILEELDALEGLGTLEKLEPLEKTCSAEFALLKQRGFRGCGTAIFRGATEVDIGLFGDFASTRGSVDKTFFVFL